MKAMQKVIEKILEQHDLTQVFLQVSVARACLQIENPPHRPLVIERPQRPGEIVISHEVLFNETPVGDPSLAFRLRDWVPLSIEYGIIGECFEVFSRCGGVEQRSDTLLDELEAFAEKWAADLEGQGFTDPSRVKVFSPTHPHLVEQATEQRACQAQARNFAPDSHLEMLYDGRTELDP